MKRAESNLAGIRDIHDMKATETLCKSDAMRLPFESEASNFDFVFPARASYRPLNDIVKSSGSGRGRAEGQAESILDKLALEGFDTLDKQLLSCCTSSNSRSEIIAISREVFDKAARRETLGRFGAS